MKIPRRPDAECPLFMLLILIMILILSKRPEKIRSKIMSMSMSSAEKAPFSADPLSLPRQSAFRHSSPPYALVSPNCQSANQKAGLGGGAFADGERQFAHCRR
jgi:hypothetical protein